MARNLHGARARANNTIAMACKYVFALILLPRQYAYICTTAAVHGVPRQQTKRCSMSEVNTAEVAAPAHVFGGTVAEVKGQFKGASDRAAWLALAAAHVGQPVQAWYAAAVAIGPSGPSKAPKSEPAHKWVKWLIKNAYVIVA